MEGSAQGSARMSAVFIRKWQWRTRPTAYYSGRGAASWCCAAAVLFVLVLCCYIRASCFVLVLRCYRYSVYCCCVLLLKSMRAAAVCCGCTALPVSLPLSLAQEYLETNGVSGPPGVSRCLFCPCFPFSRLLPGQMYVRRVSCRVVEFCVRHTCTYTRMLHLIVVLVRYIRQGSRGEKGGD